MSVKKVWITSSGVDAYSLCIRLNPGLPLYVSTNEFPPAESIQGKKLNIDEAKRLGLAEPHHVIGHFTRDELVYLLGVIRDKLACI